MQGRQKLIQQKKQARAPAKKMQKNRARFMTEEDYIFGGSSSGLKYEKVGSEDSNMPST
jgi:hypothetical protein